MKTEFEKAEVEIIRFEDKDVIATSGGVNEAIGGSDQTVGGDDPFGGE